MIYKQRISFLQQYLFHQTTQPFSHVHQIHAILMHRVILMGINLRFVTFVLVLTQQTTQHVDLNV